MTKTLTDITTRDPEADAQRLAERLAFFERRTPESASPPQVLEHPFIAVDSPRGLPEVHARDLTSSVLRSAIHEQGCLLVRELAPAHLMGGLTEIIDAVMAATEECDKSDDNHKSHHPAFANPPQNFERLLPQPKLGWSRAFHRNGGSAMCVESAGVAESLLEMYASLGLKDLLTHFLGEPPCLSALKWVLRRPKLPIQPDGWHQDGAFMGREINSINMWLAVNACGGQSGAPSMDLVPRRLTEIFKAGTDGAVFDWSISSEAIFEEFGANSIVTPAFEPGDALFFDHFLIHRTQFAQHLHHHRYALETWFFGERHYPANQVPLRW